MDASKPRYVIIRNDNHHYMMNVNETLWSHHIDTAKSFTKEEAENKIEELERQNLDFLVHMNLASEERKRYRSIYG